MQSSITPSDYIFSSGSKICNVFFTVLTFCIHIVTENLFTTELPTVEGSKKTIFIKGSFTKPSKKNGICEWTGQGRMSIMNLFVARGVKSRQPMQPTQHNHRMLNPNVLMYPHKDDVSQKECPALLQSLFSSDPKYSFDMGNPISIAPYEVSCDTRYRLCTHSIFEVQLENDKPFSGLIEAEDVSAGLLTVGSFRRLTEVLGLHWDCKEEDAAKLDMEYFMTLMEELSKFPLVSNKDIHNFMKAFKLERFFKFDKHQTPGRNRDLLCELFSCLQPVRIAIYDGQHRSVLCCRALLDYWIPGFKASLDPEAERKKLKDAIGDIGKLFTVPNMKEKDLQCHKELSFRYGFVTMNDSYGDHVTTLRNHGRNQAAAQETNIDTNIHQILVEFVMRGANDCDQPMYTPDTIWGCGYDDFKRNVEGVQEPMTKSFIRFIKDQNLETHIGYPSKEGFNEQALIEAAKKNQYRPSIVTQKTELQPGVPTQACYMFLLLRNFMATRRGKEALIKFASSVPPQVENTPISPAARAQLRTYEFLRHRVLKPLVAISDSINSRVEWEMLLLKKIQNDPDKTIMDITNKTTGDDRFNVSTWDKFQLFKDLPKADQKRNARYTRPQGLEARLKETITSQLMIDTLETITYYGWDPRLTVHDFLTSSQYIEYEKSLQFPNDCLRLALL